MNERPELKQALGRLLGPGVPEVGCEECFDKLDQYVELDPEGAPVRELGRSLEDALGICCDDLVGRSRFCLPPSCVVDGRGVHAFDRVSGGHGIKPHCGERCRHVAGRTVRGAAIHDADRDLTPEVHGDENGG